MAAVAYARASRWRAARRMTSSGSPSYCWRLLPSAHRRSAIALHGGSGIASRVSRRALARSSILDWRAACGARRSRVLKHGIRLALRNTSAWQIKQSWHHGGMKINTA